MVRRFLLCRPQGGLNDNLTQIEECWRYAERHERILIIDTSKSGGFYCPFGTCFKLARDGLQNVYLELTEALSEEIQSLSTFPRFLQLRLNVYESKYSRVRKNFIDRQSGARITFDFDTEYSESLLVHDQCGGGTVSLICLARLRLSGIARVDVLKRLSMLGGGNYFAAVVRNTDYTTDYEKFFAEIYADVRNQRLLVCSDSVQVIEYARNYFTESDVLVLAGTPDTGGRSLASYMELVDRNRRYEILIKSISDLIGLASASTLFVSRLRHGGIGGISGFALLATNLNRNPAVLRQLLSDQ